MHEKETRSFLRASGDARLLLVVSGFASDAAEDDRVGQCVAAQTVRAVDAAGHFARSIQTRNHVAVFIQHLRIHVDAHAAHRVMHGGNAGSRVEGRGVDGGLVEGTAEFVRRARKVAAFCVTVEFRDSRN